MKYISYYSYLLILCSASWAYADKDDTRFLLESSRYRETQYQQSPWLQETSPHTEEIVLDGQSYRVENNVEDLSLAIYSAMSTQQWQKLQIFVHQYQQLEGHQEALVLLAKGLLARSQGHYRTAIQYLETAKQQNPEDARIQLELARIYTEDNQNKEAIEQFNAVLKQEIPQTTKEIVTDYIHHIQARNHWHGSLSFGYGYNSNINQANGFKQYLTNIFSPGDVIEQSLPEAVESTFANYQLLLSKKIALHKNHSVQLRAISYGRWFKNKDEQTPVLRNRNEHTTQLYAGYHYNNATLDISVLPYWEHYYRGNHTDYTAMGIDATLDWDFNPQWRFNWGINSKRFHYTQAGKQLSDDYTQSTLSTGMSYQLTPSTLIYGGLDWTRNRYAMDTDSSKEFVYRLGLYQQFSDRAYVNLLAFYRDARYDDKPYYLSEKRQDRQKIFIASIGIPKWSYKKIYPEIRFKRVIANSNGIFYRYKQNEISLNLKYNF